MLRQERRWTDQHESDPYRDFVEAVPNLAKKARKAAKDEAFSYRDFRVGCAVLGISGGIDTMVTAAGGNIKVRGQEKICAERVAARRAEDEGVIAIIGVVVVGTSNPAEIKAVTGLATPTLHMCSECRIDFSDTKSRFTDETLVVTSGLTTDYYQTHLFGQLRELYDDECYEELMGMRISSDFDNWQRRVNLYDNLVIGEQEDMQRHRAELAQRALIAPIANPYQ